MSDKVDIAKFEALAGRELGRYVFDLHTHGFDDSSFVDAVNARSHSWDAHHIDSAIRLLVELKTPLAYREISKHLTHPSLNVRVGAVNGVRDAKDVDEFVMMQVTQALPNLDDD